VSKADTSVTVGEAVEGPEEHIDQERREALKRFAKYTAPAMLGLLLSGQNGMATPCTSNCV
jgi:hypothetical protein